ncbi:MAG TPA: LysM peptidoglycan-binding domain-containing protein [Ilumatobacteraceae bacterium]|nr:LysM peptidoglycan-binding domain-containing protein [Ilumatobacteraceae bacterium]
MQSSHSRRLGAVVVPVIAGALLLASCGGADNAATQSTIDLSAESTAFVVRPPATTIPVADTTEPVAGAVVTTEQEYLVVANDTPIGVAKKFNVPVADLIAYNEWGPNEFAYPGDTIKIPPGGTAPGAAVAEDATATAGSATTAPAGTIPDAGDNCSQGDYTIADGDFEGKVATNFDVTVEALRAANASTPNYSSFYPGLVIVIPAKADC